MKKFANLKKSGTYTSPKIDDREFYDDVIQAFERLDFTEGE
jgi:hypothetical protein